MPVDMLLPLVWHIRRAMAAPMEAARPRTVREYGRYLT
jgi:hypothetical protein